eukprot:Gb_36347 [translate_table: standard]
MARVLCKWTSSTSGNINTSSIPADLRCVCRLSSALEHNVQKSTKNSEVALYFHRAKLIDKLRVLLHNKPWKPSTVTVLERLELDTFVVSQVLRSTRLSADTALSFFRWLKAQPDFCHNQHTHHAIIKIVSDAGRVQEMQTMVNDINNAGKYKKVSVSFMDLLRWYARAKNLEGVSKTWDEMKQMYANSYARRKPNAEAYNILIDMFAARNNYSEVAKLFTEMMQEGVLPNARTYTVLIKHLVKIGKLNEALEIFKKLPLLRVKHTTKQYVILADAFSRMNDVDIVRLLIKEMQKDGILPSRALFSAVEVLRKEGLHEEAEEIASELLPDANIEALEINQNCSDDDNDNEDEDSEHGDDLKEGSQTLKPWLNPNALANALSEWTPATVSALEKANLVWNTRLVCKVLRAFKKVDTAWEFFRWVAYQPGFAHDIYTVSRMIVMLAREGKAELVDHLLSKARMEGLKLSISTMRLIIEAYGISKNSDAALRVFREIKSFGLKPNRVLYSSLIHTFVKCKQGFKAVDILEEMMLASICPDIQIFSGLMQHFAIAGDLKTMQVLFTWITQSGGEPDAHAYRILIRAYCKNGRAAVAKRLYEDMKSAYLMPDASTKSLLVNSLWTEGKLREAAEVEDKSEKEGFNLPKSLPGSIWRASCADLVLISNIISKSFV